MDGVFTSGVGKMTLAHALSATLSPPPTPPHLAPPHPSPPTSRSAATANSLHSYAGPHAKPRSDPNLTQTCSASEVGFSSEAQKPEHAGVGGGEDAAGASGDEPRRGFGGVGGTFPRHIVGCAGDSGGAPSAAACVDGGAHRALQMQGLDAVAAPRQPWSGPKGDCGSSRSARGVEDGSGSSDERRLERFDTPAPARVGEIPSPTAPTRTYAMSRMRFSPSQFSCKVDLNSWLHTCNEGERQGVDTDGGPIVSGCEEKESRIPVRKGLGNGSDGANSAALDSEVRGDRAGDDAVKQRGKFGGRFWCLASDEESEDEAPCTMSQPAMSPMDQHPICSRDLSGWSAPVCRKRIPSGRSKQRRPLKVDGHLQRSARRWINLGSAGRDHRPPPNAVLGDALVNARTKAGFPADEFRSKLLVRDDRQQQREPVFQHRVAEKTQPYTWRQSMGSHGAVPTLDTSHLDHLFGHLWAAARSGPKTVEEWPRVGVGDPSLPAGGATMYNNRGGGQGRPWQGGGQGDGGRFGYNNNGGQGNQGNFNGGGRGNFNNNGQGIFSNTQGNFNNPQGNFNNNNNNGQGNFNTNNGNWNRGNNNKAKQDWRPTANKTTVSDPGKVAQGSTGHAVSVGSGTSAPDKPATSATATSPPAPAQPSGAQHINKEPQSLNGKKGMKCQKCNSTMHTSQGCKEKLLCDICQKVSHITDNCVWPSQPKPVIQLVGFAAKGLGCFFAQSTKKINTSASTNILVLVCVKKGNPSSVELEAGLGRSFQADWQWKAKEIDANRFLVRFPNADLLDRALGFDEFTLKGTGVSVSVSKWSSASMAKAKLFSVWVKISGIPEELMHYKGICEASSPLGVLQEVDIASLIKFQLVRAKIGVRDPGLIPPSAEITTDPYVYDAFYELESVAEKGGLLDENGMLIDIVQPERSVNMNVDSGNKRLKTCDKCKDNAGGDNNISADGIFVSKDDLLKIIQEETERRVAVEMQKMEERVLRAQLKDRIRRIIARKRSIDERTDGDNYTDQLDYGDGENVNLSQGTEMSIDKNTCEEEVSPTQTIEDIEKQIYEEVEEEIRMEKEKEKSEEENIRNRLRPQGDGTILEKAQDFTTKRNLEQKDGKVAKNAAARI